MKDKKENASLKKDVKYSNTGVGLKRLNKNILKKQLEQIKEILKSRS